MPNHCENCPRSNKENCDLLDLHLQSFTREEIEQDLIQALTLIFKNEGGLLERDIHERTITFYLTHYFMNLFHDKYDGYNIDPEYNRNGKEAKYYDDVDAPNQPKAIPDIIVHRRNCNKYNLLYLELKKGQHDSKDCNKIKRFMSDHIIPPWGDKKNPTFYNYEHGVSVALYEKTVSLKWYIKEADTWIQNEYSFTNDIFERKTQQ